MLRRTNGFNTQEKLRFLNPPRYTAFSFFIQYEATDTKFKDIYIYMGYMGYIWGYKVRSSPPPAADLGQTKANEEERQ